MKLSSSLRGMRQRLLPSHGGSFPVILPTGWLEDLFKVCVSKVMDGSTDFLRRLSGSRSANKRMRGDVTERRSPAGASGWSKAHQAAADPGLDAPRTGRWPCRRSIRKGRKDRASTTMPALSKYPNDMGRNRAKTPEELRSRHYLRNEKGRSIKLRPRHRSLCRFEHKKAEYQAQSQILCNRQKRCK